MKNSRDVDNVPRLVKDFASYKQTIEGCSAQTVEQYLSDLKMFFKYVYAIRNRVAIPSEFYDKIQLSGLDREFICSVSPEEIYDFFYYLSNVRGNNNATRSRRLSAVKSFYKYVCQKQRLMEKDPTSNMEGPKKKNSLPKFLTVDESVALLEAVESDTESKNRERDYAIITLFLNCGMRLSELCGINLRDMDRELRSLRVLGKGNKERIIYLNDSCRSALERYLLIRREEKYKKINTDALFISKQYNRISKKTVQWLVYKYLGLAGLGYKRFSTHKLRHTAATLMYQTGKVDVRVLKEILGHEQLNTTQIYTHVSNKGMQDAVDSNPLANIKVQKNK